MYEFDDMDETFVCNFHNPRKEAIAKIVTRLTDIENGPIFEIRDVAYDVDGNVLSDHFAVHVYQNQEGDIHRFFEHWNISPA